MPPPVKYPVKISPTYVAELRARVEAIGVVAVARAAGLTRTTIWRAFASNSGRAPTLDAIERIRRAAVKLDPQGGPIAPPMIMVRGRAHFAWCAIADETTAADLARVADDPALVRELIATIKRRR